jgi:hypothetical protein
MLGKKLPKFLGCKIFCESFLTETNEIDTWTREGTTCAAPGSPEVTFEPGGSLTTSASPAGGSAVFRSCEAAVSAEKL